MQGLGKGGVLPPVPISQATAEEQRRVFAFRDISRCYVGAMHFYKAVVGRRLALGALQVTPAVWRGR